MVISFAPRLGHPLPDSPRSACLTSAVPVYSITPKSILTWYIVFALIFVCLFVVLSLCFVVVVVVVFNIHTLIQ